MKNMKKLYFYLLIIFSFSFKLYGQNFLNEYEYKTQSNTKIYNSIEIELLDQSTTFTEVYQGTQNFNLFIELLSHFKSVNVNNKPSKSWILSIDLDSIKENEFQFLQSYLIQNNIKNVILVPVHSNSHTSAQSINNTGNTNPKSNYITAVSISVAIIKSAIGTYYYFHYLPFTPALIGSVFSTVHNLIFTLDPNGEQKYLLNPVKKIFNVDTNNIKSSKNIDLITSSIHKLVNLGIVSTIINWESLNISDVIFSSINSAFIYTIIKNFWKIHFDYQLKLNKISPTQYKYIIPSLELTAFGVMPGIMKAEPLAITVGAVLGITGLLNYYRESNLTTKTIQPDSLTCMRLFRSSI